MADTEQYRPAVVILEQDLFFSVRLEDVVRAAGGDPITVEDADLFVAAVERTFPTLALLDLKTPGDWETAVRQCKMKPHTRQTPIYAFGSHVDVETLQRARKAGADHAWARSHMMEETGGGSRPSLTSTGPASRRLRRSTQPGRSRRVACLQPGPIF